MEKLNNHGVIDMKRYWAYFKYICRHKWYFAIAAYNIGVSIKSIITHDLSKFLPSEFFLYARTFYTQEGTSTFVDSIEFDKAWLLHQRRNKHHHNYWTYVDDSGVIHSVDIPDEYLLEMIADWLAMERSVPGSSSAASYYLKIRRTAYFHDNTDKKIQELLMRHSVLFINTESQLEALY